jgi:hypothetical protein
MDESIILKAAKVAEAEGLYLPDIIGLVAGLTAPIIRESEGKRVNSPFIVSVVMMVLAGFLRADSSYTRDELVEMLDSVVFDKDQDDTDDEDIPAHWSTEMQPLKQDGVPKSERVSLRVSPEEKSYVQKVAQEDGCDSVSEWGRWVILNFLVAGGSAAQLLANNQSRTENSND